MMKILLLLIALAYHSLAAARPFSADTSENTIAFVHANVWDGKSDHTEPGCTVIVRENHIVQVGRGLSVPAGAKVIDCGGGTLIPGLSDAHLHLMFNVPMDEAYDTDHWAYVSARATKTAENFLMLGFTTIRDMGGPVFGIKQAIDEGIVPGPRIYPSGALISQTSGHGDMRNPNDLNPNWAGNNASLFQLLGWSYLADGRDQVLNGVRENLRHGSTQIKMMAGGGVATEYDPLHTVQFTEDELRAGVQAAGDWGTYVGVHVYNAEGIERALRAGVKTIEHGHLIDDEAMKMIRDRGAYLIPQSYWVTMDADSFSNNPDKFRQTQQGAVHEMELAKKYGVKLGFGTDVFGALGIESDALKEFEARTRWYTPVEVLRQATSGNAEIFALSGKLNPYPDGKLGVIEPGAYADLLIYDANPLEDISVVTRPDEHLKLILKDGKIYKNELGKE